MTGAGLARRVAPTAPPAPRGASLIERWRERKAAQLYARQSATYRTEVRLEFGDVCEALGACHSIDTPTGRFVRTPRVGGVSFDAGSVTITCELMPGQEPEDLAAMGARLAHSLGGQAIRVEPIRNAGRWVRVTVLDDDPLAGRFDLPWIAARHGGDPVLLGRTEAGDTIAHAFREAAHLGLQGQNGSGKSAFTYCLLCQLAGAPDVIVAGSDITGLTLGRAWDDTCHRAWQVVGADDLEAHAAGFEAAVAEMDRRRLLLPHRMDKLPPTIAPTLVWVVEELPNLLRAADALGKSKTGRSVGDRIRSAQGRLVSEGRKYGVRCVSIAQRFEATATGGGYARDQYSLAVSFRVPGDSLVMLHGDDARPLGPEHSTAPAGVALVSAPGRAITRVRAPYIAGDDPDGAYAAYCDRIAWAAA